MDGYAEVNVLVLHHKRNRIPAHLADPTLPCVSRWIKLKRRARVLMPRALGKVRSTVFLNCEEFSDDFYNVNLATDPLGDAVEIVEVHHR